MNPAPTLHTIRREYKLPNFGFDLSLFFTPLFSENWKGRRNLDLLPVDIHWHAFRYWYSFTRVLGFSLLSPGRKKHGTSKNEASKLKMTKQTETETPATACTTLRYW